MTTSTTSSQDQGQCGQNSQIVRDLVAAWNSHDPHRVEAFYSANYEGEDVAEAAPHHGPHDMRRFMSASLEAFPDFHLDVERCVAEDDRVAIFWVLSGTHLGRTMNIPPSGREIHARGASLLQVVDGKVSYSLQVWDVAGMLRSIGLLPDLPV